MHGIVQLRAQVGESWTNDCVCVLACITGSMLTAASCQRVKSRPQKFRAMPLRDTEATTVTARTLQQAQIRRMLEAHLV